MLNIYSIFITAWGCHIEQLISLNLSTNRCGWIPFVNKMVPDVWGAANTIFLLLNLKILMSAARKNSMSSWRSLKKRIHNYSKIKKTPVEIFHSRTLIFILCKAQWSVFATNLEIVARFYICANSIHRINSYRTTNHNAWHTAYTYISSKHNFRWNIVTSYIYLTL
jgi:hypothetical protein